MQRTPKIRTVEDNKEKQKTYQKGMERYKQAMEAEFYYEALLIAYAMIEDRLRSLLFHMGVIKRIEDTSPKSKKNKKLIRIIYFSSEEDALKKRINFNRIADKLKMIKRIIEWASENTDDTSLYGSILKECIRGIDNKEVLATIERIEKWKDYRNEIIHGLFNKRVEELDSISKEKAKEAMDYARKIDNYVGQISGRKIRYLIRLD